LRPRDRGSAGEAGREGHGVRRPPVFVGAHALHDERRLGALLLAPAVIYIALLVGLPFLLAIYYSVSDVTVGNYTPEFVGLRNFRRILDDPTFWRSLQNAVVFTVATQILVIVLAHVLALALYADFRGKW